MGGKKKKDKTVAWEPEDEQDETALAPTEERALDPVLYLADDAPTDPVIVALVPPDLERCQCEWRDQTIESFGPKPTIRCEHEPTVIAFQKREPDDEAPTGAISLCDVHRVMIAHMYPNQCYFRKLTPDKKIGDYA